MRRPLHIALSAPVPATASAGRAARHRKPRRPPVLAAGLGLASVLAASVLTAAVDPAAPVAPDRAPAGRSSTFAQVSGD
ncbi:hypothetical protein [Streptomyces sp. NBC_00162]|uniref:hypothetical protein n=1 Tax=Streptomyces sp. NBC_00162 TaxID=2903629 RepID=UPI00214AAB49|nr:hypothetical protein [Streptomyces sp. NBC_00162]UUU42119.1 hypothetical protein JIW86_26880 [Streptomyces sp. NBC_00162]